MQQTIKDFYNEFKPAILFLARLLVTYIVLSQIYGFWVKGYETQPDPITKGVASQVVGAMRLFYDNVSTEILEGDNSVRVWINGKPAGIAVYEGCNGVAIFYLFFAFLVGFWGGAKRLAWFSVLGIAIIHLFNLGRLLLLAYVAQNHSQLFHFTHKYLFTLSIYLIVFALWIWWIRMIKPETKAEENPQDTPPQNGVA